MFCCKPTPCPSRPRPRDGNEFHQLHRRTKLRTRVIQNQHAQSVLDKKRNVPSPLVQRHFDEVCAWTGFAQIKNWHIGFNIRLSCFFVVVRPAKLMGKASSQLTYSCTSKCRNPPHLFATPMLEMLWPAVVTSDIITTVHGNGLVSVAPAWVLIKLKRSTNWDPSFSWGSMSTKRRMSIKL